MFWGLSQISSFDTALSRCCYMAMKDTMMMQQHYTQLVGVDVSDCWQTRHLEE